MLYLYCVIILYCVCMYYCIVYMYIYNLCICIIVLYYCIVLCIICICIYCMYVYVCSSVEERLCRTLELKITNQSINQSVHTKVKSNVANVFDRDAKRQQRNRAGSAHDQGVVTLIALVEPSVTGIKIFDR